MSLTAVECKNLKATEKPFKRSDGGGLHLLVNPNGSKLWRLSYRFAGKQKTLALGRYPTVTLADARRKRSDAKAALALQADPSVHRARTAGALTFGELAQEWLINNAESWVPAHAAKVRSRLYADILPEFGDIQVTVIGPQMVLAAVRKVEARGVLETAKRLLNYIGAIFRYGVATGRAERDPTADLRGALKKAPAVKHRAAIKERELGAFMAKLSAYDGEEATRLALEVVVHTFVRTNEIRYANWSEFDGDTWRIPAERMKMRREHVVPLTPHTLRLFSRLRELSDGEHVAPMSQNTMIFAMYRLGYHSRATVHGFRSLASTVLNESGLWGFDAIERQLAHVPGDSVRSAYNSAQYMPERVRMMRWWSKFVLSKQPAPA